MGTVANILQNWASTSPAKASLYASEKGVLVSWLNEAQLQFTDISECLRDVWQPTITSSGNVALPSDFKREIKDRVKWDTNTYLQQIDYPTANLITTWSGTYKYSIWGDTFYVWAAAAGTPSIPYIKKPTEITVANIATADLEIPTEYHYILKIYLNAMMAERANDIAGSLGLMKQFQKYAEEAYAEVVRDNDPVPMMRGRFF